MSLELITGNRMEHLADELAGELRRVPADPLASEIIVVHGPAMQRWLSLQLARKLGICANTHFDYPNALLSALVRRVMPAIGTSPFEPDILTWKIIELLPGLCAQADFGPVAGYLRQAQPRMIYQLASRIAAAFDQYLIYRPDMLEAWQAGRLVTDMRREEAWQAELWRRLVSGLAERHRAEQVRLFFEKLSQCPQPGTMLPARISVFGISYLPPFHVHFFNRLSGYIPVRMYVTNPCREYWADIVSRSRAARLSAGTDPDSLYLEQGHPLLASWGAHGREFFSLAEELNLNVRECFDENLPPTMLGRLQADILHLTDRAQEGGEPFACRPEDRSIQVHSCHGPTRELEVLRDCLLELFSANPDLRPDDVLVLTPDMQHYVACIQAVFGTADGIGIPFSIADRSLLGTASMLHAFQALLRLPATRMLVSDVLPMLECAAVQRRFGLTQEDIETLQEWIAGTRICWALDADERLAAGLPATPENTWRFGLERMLLGHAMDEGDGLFEGTLAFDAVQGNAGLAGILAEIIDQLAGFKKDIAAERTLGEWSAFLQETLQRFFEPAPEDEQAWKRLQQCSLRLQHVRNLTGFEAPVAFEMLLESLDSELKRCRHPAGFFSGSVTFAEMQPMRGIPFRVVCLIGMHDRAFPRQSFPPGFHLMAQRARPGDRDAGKDDRYMFLEALLSARDAFIITYTGQSQQDNAPLPPSVLVSELLDELEASCRIEAGTLKEHMFFEQHLQPFNAHYFIDNTRMQSFSQQHLACARALQESTPAAPDFFEAPLPQPQAEGTQLSVDELVRFFNNPPGHLLRERLNISLEPQAFSIAERESFQLAGLERYDIEQALLRELRADPGAGGSFERCAARGILPHGAAGRAAWENALASVRSFAGTLRRAGIADADVVTRQVVIDLGDCTLSAELGLQADGRLVRMRHAKLKPKDFLRAWLEYLVVCCAPGDAAPCMLLAGLDSSNRAKTRIWHFSPVEGPQCVLAGLVALYREGMCRPLAFIPQASFAYAEALHSKKPAQVARAAAGKSLARDGFSTSELEDVSFGRFFDESIVESPDFDRCARAVFGPLLEHRRLYG